jgi:hypothetical protein
MNDPTPLLPPVPAACRMTVVIPAKNEEAFILRALQAFAEQRDAHGARLDLATFDVIVYCNDCIDGTADRARRFAEEASGLSIHVVDGRLPSTAAHVGTARRNALELAAQRFEAARRTDGIVASTDADSVVDPTWVTTMLREMRGVDAVAGHVTIDASERDAMLAPLRLLYDRELVYRRELGFAESRFDPRPYDPFPRHDTFVGANFATTVLAYRRAGGLAPLPRLEDLAFSRALERVDARIRHTYDATAVTSARSIARVDGGFGTFLTELSTLGDRKGEYLVRSGRAIVEDAMARNLLRAYWLGEHSAVMVDALTDLVEQTEGTLRTTASEANTFGAFCEAVQSRAPQRAYPHEPVQSAILSLRAALSDAMPRVPTRSNVASGAG